MRDQLGQRTKKREGKYVSAKHHLRHERRRDGKVGCKSLHAQVLYRSSKQCHLSGVEVKSQKHYVYCINYNSQSLNILFSVKQVIDIK